MTDIAKLLAFCFIPIIAIVGLVAAPGLVQEKTAAALPSPSPEQVVEVEQVEQVVEVEQVEQAPAKIEKVECGANCLALRKSCFYMLADVSVNGATLTEGICTSSQMKEWDAADTACQVSLITQGVCE